MLGDIQLLICSMHLLYLVCTDVNVIQNFEEGSLSAVMSKETKLISMKVVGHC